MFPHQFLEAYLDEILGRRINVLGPLKDELLTPLVIGLMDQLSAYLDIHPGAHLTLHDVHIQHGAERSYLLAGLRDGGRPLRLRAAMQHWGVDLISSRPEDFVEANIGRRWRFVDHNRRLLEQLFTQLSDAIVSYYARRPGAQLQTDGGMPRFLEGVDTTWLTLELDDRGEQKLTDKTERYRVQ